MAFSLHDSLTTERYQFNLGSAGIEWEVDARRKVSSEFQTEKGDLEKNELRSSFLQTGNKNVSEELRLEERRIGGSNELPWDAKCRFQRPAFKKTSSHTGWRSNLASQVCESSCGREDRNMDLETFFWIFSGISTAERERRKRKWTLHRIWGSGNISKIFQIYCQSLSNILENIKEYKVSRIQMQIPSPAIFANNTWFFVLKFSQYRGYSYIFSICGPDRSRYFTDSWRRLELCSKKFSFSIAKFSWLAESPRFKGLFLDTFILFFHPEMSPGFFSGEDARSLKCNHAPPHTWVRGREAAAPDGNEVYFFKLRKVLENESLFQKFHKFFDDSIFSTEKFEKLKIFTKISKIRETMF